MKRGLIVADKYHNQVTLRTIVKPVDKCSPFFGTPGEVRAIHKDNLFILIRKADNLHLLRNMNGIYAVKSHEVINSGFELIDTANKKGLQAVDVMHGKLDKRIKDKKATN